jgi:ribosome-binding ATPase YchF (GTP1/OBG family)
MKLTDEEREILKDLFLLTNKKFIYACNVNEDMMDSTEEELKKLL